jgi:ABC-type Co2+ transport system permease subunit
VSPFEHLLTFASIVLGLAVTDLAMALSRLLHAGTRVTWGLTTPLADIVVFLKIISQWWTWYVRSRQVLKCSLS